MYDVIRQGDPVELVVVGHRRLGLRLSARRQASQKLGFTHGCAPHTSQTGKPTISLMGSTNSSKASSRGRAFLSTRSWFAPALAKKPSRASISSSGGPLL